MESDRLRAQAVTSTFTALRVRNFRWYIAGSVISNSGTWMQRVAEDWLVLTLTGGSAGALGIITALQFLPYVLFSPMAGVLADRFSKRWVMIVSQSTMAAIVAVLGILAVAEAVHTWQVGALAFAFGTAAAVDAPARQAFVHEMVGSELVGNAVGLYSASFNISRMLGPAIGGGTIAMLGSGVRATGWVILINAGTYVAVVAVLFFLRTHELHATPRLERGKGQLRAGIRYVRSRSDLLLIFGVIVLTGTFTYNYPMFTALMATQEFGKGAGEFGILASVLSVGSLVGALLAARGETSSQRFVVGAAIGFGGITAVAGAMPSYVSFAVVLPFAGAISITLWIAATSYVQLTVDPAMRGRVMALFLAVFASGTPVGAPMIGWVADHAGARWTLVGGGVVTAVGTLALAVGTARRRGMTVRLRVAVIPRSLDR